MTLKENVERGIALLDEKVPGWDMKIDLEMFEIASRSRCALGQVFGNYETGIEELFGDSLTTGAFYGFEWDNHPNDYVELNALWADEINARREMRAASLEVGEMDTPLYYETLVEGQ